MSGEPDGVSLSPSSSSSSGGSAGAVMGGWGSGGTPRPLSANVRRLHGALQELLSAAERERFLRCLNGYRARRNVCDLVGSLQALLDAPEKRRLLPLLRLVIPRADQLLFDQYTSQGLYLPDPRPTPWQPSQGHILHHTGGSGGSPLHFQYEYGMGSQADFITDGVAPRRLPVHFPYEYDGRTQTDEVAPRVLRGDFLSDGMAPRGSRQDFLTDGGSRQNFLTDRTAPKGSRQDFLSNGGLRQDFQTNMAAPGRSQQHFLSNRTATRGSQQDFLSNEMAPSRSQQDFLSDETTPRGSRQDFLTNRTVPGGSRQHFLSDGTAPRVSQQDFLSDGGSQQNFLSDEAAPRGSRQEFLSDGGSRQHFQSDRMVPRGLRQNISTSDGTVPRVVWQDLSTKPEGTALHGLEELQGEVRQVTLRRAKAQEGLGFSIRGGSEHGVGIFVSLVEPGSLAEKEGLRVGDKILTVNDKPLDKVTHAEAVKVLKGSKKLNLSVHSMGCIPGGYVTNHIYTWVDPQGRSISPPTGLPQHQSNSLRKEGEKRSHLQLLQEGDEKKVNLVLSEGRSLGLMIRGGAEYALGIYITGVDKESEAESTGLKVGDQILEVNGRSFLSIPHDEAVKLLKSSRHLIMTVKDVGRLPHARTTVDETKWITSSQIEETVVSPAGVSSDHSAEVAVKPSFYRGLAGSQMTLSSFVNQSRVVLEEQARHLLNEPERATMGYYLDEYKESNIPVDALVMALFELLNTHAKFSLLSEVRGMISPQDLDRFDNLVLKREIEFMKARQPSGTGTGTDSYSMTSYGDTVSSTGSHFTSTTVSSARERLLWLIDLMENTSDLEGAGNGGTVDALPDISLDDVSSFPEEPPAFKPLPPTPSPQSANPQNTAKDTLMRPSSESSQSGLFFVAPQNPTPPPSLSEKDTASISSSVTTCSTEDSASSTVYASVSSASRRSMDAHLALVNQHPIGPFPRVQSPTRLKNPTADTTLTSTLPHSGAPSPSPPPPPLHPAPPPPGPESSAAQHFIMVEVHQPNSEPDVNEVRSLPQARALLLLSPAPASTLSQLSDSGQTLSEDSGVDIGEAELGTRDRGRLHEPVKSRSPLGAHRTDRVADAALKPPGLLEPTSHLIRVTKSAPTLGIAIEGGANTRQPLPRIVTIQRGGSAHNCGKLKVGHVILEVNGIALRGKEHRQAARIIAEAFKAKDKDYVDFQVTEFNVAL